MTVCYWRFKIKQFKKVIGLSSVQFGRENMQNSLQNGSEVSFKTVTGCYKVSS